ncbi:hypothetical protein L1987_86659 [Smallanthus sonchifolius]|uniref:Uncharacterized protein n=1 Tax=Smallanthus sonchifolius TaxID=185202 RepID=A0ACB8Y028_9ASTR|nr:hypothetical protein L1987_86659 [Smallanthus sonchifolius]
MSSFVTLGLSTKKIVAAFTSVRITEQGSKCYTTPPKTILCRCSLLDDMYVGKLKPATLFLCNNQQGIKYQFI